MDEPPEPPSEPAAPPGRGRSRVAVLLFLLATLGVIGFLGWTAMRRTPVPDAPLPIPSRPIPTAPGSVPPRDGVRTLGDAEQLRRGFRAAFGSEGAASRRVDGHDQFEDDLLVYRPAALRWVGDKAALVSLGTNQSDCHACSGAIAVHYLRPRGDTFVVEAEWLAAVVGSGWGAASDGMTIRDDLASWPVVASERGFTGQGCTSRVLSLTELRPEGPVRWDDVPIAYDDAGTIGAQRRGARDVEGRISNVRKGALFRVTYSGTERFSEDYVRRGDRFVRAGGESRAPAC